MVKFARLSFFLFSLAALVSPIFGQDYSAYLNNRIFQPCMKPVCYDDVGCFQPFKLQAYLGLPPVAACPQPPDELGVEFKVMRYNNSYEFFNLFGISPNSSVAYVIPGYRSEHTELFNMELVDGLLKHYDQIVLVRWDLGANPSLLFDIPVTRYNKFLAAANSEAVGRIIGNSIDFIVNNRSINPDNITLVGHGLGGNTIHFAADWIKEKYNLTVGKAVVLDPDAIPFYFSNKKISGKGDAKIVDVIHSTFVAPVPVLGQRFAGNTKTGALTPTGDSDYFINFPDSWNDQPGCDGLEFCSSHFSIMTFAASLHGCRFETKPCSSNIFQRFTSKEVGLDSSQTGPQGRICIKVSEKPIKRCS
ncbi:inactive pancreatic lipase-related protein 1 [Tetranychus urticae]|uniref:Lipase domain-containing protein n=1 Tax=Tetranychus urticae TaxID=32264 RepID=T1K8E6_TETUR|nr:inactive pancreatic lipase-related protein 1 [Tetranychus urticae]